MINMNNISHNMIMMIKKRIFVLYLSFLLFFPTTIFAQNTTPSEALSPPQLSLEVKCQEEVYYGVIITLIARVDYQDNYYIIWQYSSDKINWKDTDCHDAEYHFTLSEENQFYYYRFVIII